MRQITETGKRDAFEGKVAESSVVGWHGAGKRGVDGPECPCSFRKWSFQSGVGLSKEGKSGVQKRDEMQPRRRWLPLELLPWCHHPLNVIGDLCARSVEHGEEVPHVLRTSELDPAKDAGLTSWRPVSRYEGALTKLPLAVWHCSVHVVKTLPHRPPDHAVQYAVEKLLRQLPRQRGHSFALPSLTLSMRAPPILAAFPDANRTGDDALGRKRFGLLYNCVEELTNAPAMGSARLARFVVYNLYRPALRTLQAAGEVCGYVDENRAIGSGNHAYNFLPSAHMLGRAPCYFERENDCAVDDETEEQTGTPSRE